MKISENVYQSLHLNTVPAGTDTVVDFININKHFIVNMSKSISPSET